MLRRLDQVRTLAELLKCLFDRRAQGCIAIFGDQSERAAPHGDHAAGETQCKSLPRAIVCRQRLENIVIALRRGPLERLARRYKRSYLLWHDPNLDMEELHLVAAAGAHQCRILKCETGSRFARDAHQPPALWSSPALQLYGTTVDAPVGCL